MAPTMSSWGQKLFLVQNDLWRQSWYFPRLRSLLLSNGRGLSYWIGVCFSWRCWQYACSSTNRTLFLQQRQMQYRQFYWGLHQRVNDFENPVSSISLYIISFHMESRIIIMKWWCTKKTIWFFLKGMMIGKHRIEGYFFKLCVIWGF